MESIGEKLRKAREARNISLDHVARETNISKRYLQALEEEDVSQFPGDTYTMGFIRNYAEYLGLNPPELITLYKNMRIQEQPVPIGALLEKKRSRAPLIFLGGILLLGLGVGGWWFFFGSPEARRQGAAAVGRAPMQVEFQNPFLEQSFIEGDEILFPERIGTVRITRISSTVELVGGFGRLSMKQGQESVIDIPDSTHLVKVNCSLIQRDQNPPTATLRFELGQKTGLGAAADPARPVAAEGVVALSAPIGSTNEPSRVQSSRVLLQASTKTPFTLDIEFLGHTFFRQRADGNEREERFFRRGETFQIEVQREIYLGFSNAGALRGRIQGREIEFGRPGQVGAGILKWVENPAGGPVRLEFVPMY